MDFLWEAMNCKVLIEEECDKFIQDVKQDGNKLPVNSIAEYVRIYKMRFLQSYELFTKNIYQSSFSLHPAKFVSGENHLLQQH